MNVNDRDQTTGGFGNTRTGAVSGEYSGTTRTNTDQYSTRGDVDRRVLSASTLAGDRVRNRAGEDLGKIEDIMLDLDSGRVAYAVLSFGGFLGIGDKLFAVPWQSLELNAAEHEFILDVDKQTLENAPGFDKDNWPDMADTAWGAQVHQHYGQTPYWTTGSDRSQDQSSVSTGSMGASSGRQQTFTAGSNRSDY